MISSMHLSDEDILLLIDREMPRKRTERMRTHLTACAACRSRLETAQNTLSAVSALHASQGSTAGASAALRAKIQRQTTERSAIPVGWRWPVSRVRNPWVSVAALGLAAVSMALWGGRHTPGTVSTESQAMAPASSPNAAFTPGAVRPVTLNEICANEQEDDLDPTLPASVRAIVLGEYGIASASEQDYQIDYLVNPQLGGTKDLKNLWPQPYSGGLWNARAKDQLELRLHQLVCARTINLNAAQQAIATDWIAAYKRYVRSSFDSHPA